MGRAGIGSLFFAVAAVTGCATQFADAAAEKNLALYHSVNGNDFTKRGSFVVDASSESDGLAVRVENIVSLGEEDVKNMMDTGLYQLKVVDEAKNVEVMTSVSACQLRRANFRDEISVTLGQSGSLLSVTYTPFVSPLAPPCEELSISSGKKDFDTKVSYETATPGMTIPLVLPQMKPPAGIKFFPRSESVGADRLPPTPEEEERQQQSFFRRYWYVLLPLVLLNLVGVGPEPPAEGQQQGASGAPPTSQPAAAGGGGTTRRRGKRN